MSSRSNSGADAAYNRAVAAYEEKSYEVARRWALETLAHDRQHAGARALLGRLDAARRPASPLPSSASGSEVVSTDPTVLISRGSQPATPEPIEPTVMIQRDDARRRLSDTDSRHDLADTDPGGGFPLPKYTPPRPVAEPRIIHPKKRVPAPRPKRSFSLEEGVRSLRGWLPGVGNGRRRSPAEARSTADRRSGILIAIAMVAVGSLVVWGAFGLIRWIWPAGQLLTLSKPVGGTIEGPGLECGTRGSDCSTTVATGETVELQARPDKGYVFSGFTGDCAPAGRPFMSQPRNCGATFDVVAATAPSVTFTLTITKPEGGTVIGPAGILCGALGNTCSAEVPSGVPVTLKGEAADGYTWDQFTGDCPSTGETTMTSAKTCGAIFTRTSTPLANRGPDRGPIGPPPGRRPTDSRKPDPAPSKPLPTQDQTPQPPAGTAPPVPTSEQPPTTTPDKPVVRPQTAEEHAKEEILQLVNNYCKALETLNAARIRKLFHLDNERQLKARYKEYASLKCTVTSPPEFDRLDASAAGAAQVKFGMKQNIKMDSGGAPGVKETIVTMTVSRKDFQAPWLIDRLEHVEKPK